jgi:hypothetical protein
VEVDLPIWRCRDLEAGSRHEEAGRGRASAFGFKKGLKTGNGFI